jgi:hypothetical protein
METAERDTALVGATPAWKLSDEESMERAIVLFATVSEGFVRFEAQKIAGTRRHGDGRHARRVDGL